MRGVTGYGLLVIVFVTITAAGTVAFLGLRQGQRRQERRTYENIRRSQQPLSRGEIYPLRLAQCTAKGR